MANNTWWDRYVARKRQALASPVLVQSASVPIEIGSGQAIAPVAWPWIDPHLQAQTSLPAPHARAQPEPRSGGHPPDIQDADERTQPVQSTVALPLDMPPELGRQFNIEQSELRAQLAGLNFVPYPQLTKTIVAAGANYVTALQVPDTAQLMRFQSKGATSFISRFPFALPITNQAGTDTYIDPIVLPVDDWWYCYGMKTFYIGIPTDADVVSVLFYVTQ